MMRICERMSSIVMSVVRVGYNLDEVSSFDTVKELA